MKYISRVTLVTTGSFMIIISTPWILLRAMRKTLIGPLSRHFGVCGQIFTTNIGIAVGSRIYGNLDRDKDSTGRMARRKTSLAVLDSARKPVALITSPIPFDSWASLTMAKTPYVLAASGEAGMTAREQRLRIGTGWLRDQSVAPTVSLRSHHPHSCPPRRPIIHSRTTVIHDRMLMKVCQHNMNAAGKLSSAYHIVWDSIR